MQFLDNKDFVRTDVLVVLGVVLGLGKILIEIIQALQWLAGG